MLNMDNGSERTSWAGDLVRKFESFCCDMDGILRQEIGHVENKLQTLGAKVAIICSNMDKEVSQFLEEEKESGIDVADSGASYIGTDEDHDMKDSYDANNSLSSFSVQPFENVEIESSLEQNIDSRTDENLRVTDEEILASKEEKSASDTWETDSWDNYMDAESESLLEEYFLRGNLEDDMMDSTDLMDFITAGISENEDENEIENYLHDLITFLENDDIGEANFDAYYDWIFDDDLSEERELTTLTTKNKRQKQEVAIIQRQSSIEADHESKEADHEFVGEVIQKSEEKLGTNPEFDCDEVIITNQDSEKSETSPEFECDEVIQKLEELNTNQDSDWVIV